MLDRIFLLYGSTKFVENSEAYAEIISQLIQEIKQSPEGTQSYTHLGHNNLEFRKFCKNLTVSNSDGNMMVIIKYPRDGIIKISCREGEDSFSLYVSSERYYFSLEAQFVEKKLHSIEDEPAVSFENYTGSYASEKTWINQGKRHRQNNPAFIKKFNSEIEQQDFYYHGRLLSVDMQHEHKEALGQAYSQYQRTKRKHQEKQNTSVKISKKLFRRKKDKSPILRDEVIQTQPELIERKILLEHIHRHLYTLKYHKAYITTLLQKINVMVDEEVSQIFRKTVYDIHNKEIVIDRELLDDLGLLNVNNLQQGIEEDYLHTITSKLQKLEPSLNGILQTLDQHNEHILGLNMANPNKIQSSIESLSFPSVQSDWVVSKATIPLGYYMETENQEIVIVTDGKIDQNVMKNYLTVEQTFTNSDLSNIINMLEEDIDDLNTYKEMIDEYYSLIEKHIQDSVQEAYQIILEHHQGQEEESFCDKKLLKEYGH